MNRTEPSSTKKGKIECLKKHQHQHTYHETKSSDLPKKSFQKTWSPPTFTKWHTMEDKKPLSTPKTYVTVCIYYLYLRRLMNKPVCYVYVPMSYIYIRYSTWFWYCFQPVSITSLKIQEKSCMPSFSELILIQFHLIRWVQGKRCLGVQTSPEERNLYFFWAEDISVFPKIGIPQNGWFIMENPIKMDDLGVPLFSETPIYIPPYFFKRNVTKGIGGPHGGVANPLHFVRQSFLESDKKNTATLQISTSPSSLGFDQIPCPTKAFGSPQLTRLPLWDEVNFRIIDVQSTLFLHVEFDRLNFVHGQTLLVTFLGYQILP